MNTADQYRRALERLVQRQAQHIDTLARMLDRSRAHRDEDAIREIALASATANESKILIKHLANDGGVF